MGIVGVFWILILFTASATYPKHTKLKFALNAAFVQFRVNPSESIEARFAYDTHPL